MVKSSVNVSLKFTQNNVYYTITNVLTGQNWLSATAGSTGFSNAQKRTDIACATITYKIINYLRTKNTSITSLSMDGGLRWLRKVVKLFQKHNIIVQSLHVRDRTAHNGCRPKKRRRL